MKRLLLLSIIATGLFACQSDRQIRYELPQTSLTEAGFDAAKLGQIDTLINTYLDSTWIPGAEVMILRQGQVAFHEVYGLSDYDTRRSSAKTDIYRLASMTKPITAVACLMLVEEGKIGLDDPIGQYLPTFQNSMVLDSINWADSTHTTVAADRSPTVRHLLTHTSGIGYPFIQKEAAFLYYPHKIIDAFSLEADTLADKMDLLGERPLLHQPGVKWTYGMSIDVVGYLVEKVSGMSLADFFRQRIFDPLDMDDTWFYLPESKYDQLVGCYGNTPEGLKNSLQLGPAGAIGNYPKEGAMTYYSGGGGLSGTAENYARFAQMLANGGSFNGRQLLKPETVEMMQSNQLDPEIFGQYQFGLGVSVSAPRENASHPDRAGASGWGGFFKTTFWVDPSEDLVVVIMGQMNPSQHLDKMFNKTRNIVYRAILPLAQEEGTSS
ncbi:MAG: serine hydrolase domain-containing protein [Bacteroidota bacterium]